MAALGAVFGSNALDTWQRRSVSGRCSQSCIGAQSGNGIEELAAVPQRRDAKLLQVLSREVRENRLVYVILAEDRLVLPEAQAT